MICGQIGLDGVFCLFFELVVRVSVIVFRGGESARGFSDVTFCTNSHQVGEHSKGCQCKKSKVSHLCVNFVNFKLVDFVHHAPLQQPALCVFFLRFDRPCLCSV